MLGLLMAALVWCAPATSAQDPAANAAAAEENDPAGETAATGPTLKDYKGVTIGMSADEARQKLGKPESKGEKQDLFLISDGEMVQVFYDADKKVNAVVVNYTGKNTAAPSAAVVLGADVAPGPDGRVYKLVRYPTAGYWVAYSRTAGDAPIVSVTMKKMRQVKP